MQAVEAEVQRWIAYHGNLTDVQGHRQVVRNGHAWPRSVVSPDRTLAPAKA